ncbi:hypothetical protein [Herbaspirillum seropedicae]|nr:hypothetical protein [Herbaspirillum seropedicae]
METKLSKIRQFRGEVINGRALRDANTSATNHTHDALTAPIE